MTERSWGKALGLSVAGALGAGVVVAVIASVIGVEIASRECAPDAEECLAPLAGLVYGVIAGVIAAAITILVLAIWLRVGVAFGIGSALALLVIARAVWGAFGGQGPLLVLLAAVLFAGGTIASRPRRTTVLVGLGVVLLTALPVGAKLVSVWSEQRKIEAVVERPLQTDLEGTTPYSVRYSSTGVEYAVLEPPTPHGDRIAEVDVSVRHLAADQEPCTGFKSVTQCTELSPNLWQARGPEGETWYFVHAEDRQWASVSAGTYGGDEAQRRHDARADQVARSLEPRSAWPLAADSAECGFCEWLS